MSEELITRQGWSKRFLKQLDCEPSGRNLSAMVAWVSAEGTTAKWNPLATTLKWPGSTDFNSVGVQNYVTFEDGIDATVKTILEAGHGYELIVHRLRKPTKAKRILEAVEESEWGTGGLALLVLQSFRRYDNYDTYARRPIGQ